MRYSPDLALLPQNLIKISQEPEKKFKLNAKSFRKDLGVGAVFTFDIECRDFIMDMVFTVDRWDTVYNTEINGIIYLDKIAVRDNKSGRTFSFQPAYDDSVPTAFESDEYLIDSKSLFLKMIQFIKSYNNVEYSKHFENTPELKLRNTRETGSGPSQLFSLIENVVYLRT